MSADAYAPCPGGTGKKIKFCCTDLMQELATVHRMIEGEQPAASLEQVNKLHAKHGDRACLLALKAMLQIEQGQVEPARATVATFLEKFPANPVAHAHDTLLRVLAGDIKGAVTSLQASLDNSGNEIHELLYDAIGSVAVGLLSEGHFIAGRAHLGLQLGLSGGKDERALTLLIRINSSPQIPVLLKEDRPLEPWPEGIHANSIFAEAMNLASHGRWLAAADKFAKVSVPPAAEPVRLKNLAILRGRLADSAAIGAWRAYAALNVPRDDAVEAEGTAQLLERKEGVDAVDILRLTYPITSVEEVESRLSNSPSAVRLEVTPDMADEGEPPPRSRFMILDRPVPATGVGVTVDSVPSSLAEAFVFGKQTDREARLEVVVDRLDRDQAEQALRQLLGDLLSAAEKEEVVEQMAMTARIFDWNWHLPGDTPREEGDALFEQKVRQVVLRDWPETPLATFDGKPAREAAADPRYQIRVLGAILLLELDVDLHESTELWNELRSNLGLPKSEPIEPAGINVRMFPVARLHRLIVDKLSDEAVVDAFRRAVAYHVKPAMYRLAQEVVNRTSIAPQERLTAYQLLSRSQKDPKAALTYIQQAKSLARQVGQSCAQFDLDELTLQVLQGNGEAVVDLVGHIQQQHMREPGVAQKLYQLLMMTGMISPTGEVAAAPQDRPSPILVPGGAAEPGKLWTPDAATAGEKKKIWTPG